ncbi:MAG: hypothetical protein EPN85_03695 [Bacteroidetes bacterium]|nr:MAG: hypothetical protein EPN85_03695 [Bacteroidota bacterium]
MNLSNLLVENFIKNKNIIFLLLFAICNLQFVICNSQDYLGFANSPFAGVTGIDVNPASIVNNPRKWDITLFGMNLGVGNNYMGLQKRALEHTGKLTTGDYPAFSDEDFINNYLSKRDNGKPISVHVALNLTLPSFMFTRKKHKDAFAFTCKSRIYANVDGIDPDIVQLALSGGTDSTLFFQDLTATGISAQTMIWNEYGITYGKTVMQTNNERLNVAGRLKLLQGLYSMYVFIKDVNYKFYEKDSLLVLSSQVNYGHSSNLEFNPEAAKFGFGGKPSFGLDLGASYEFYSLTEVRSKMSSQSNTTPLQHDYKYKLGFSLQDLGWIKFLKPEHARDFTMEVNQDLDFSSLQGSGETPLADVDDSLHAKYKMDASDDKFRMNLPTLASLQGDYYAGKNISVNSTLNYAFQFRNNANKIHEITAFSITPRWDWKWLGFYMPFSYNKYSHVRMGASARIGPLIVGMADVLPLISKRDVYGVDLHVMLKVPHIHLKKKNKHPRSKSKFNTNREDAKKTAKKNKDKSHMPKKDSAKKKKDHNIKSANRDQKARKHIFPRVHIFKNKRKHKAKPENRDNIIYFQL